MSNNHEISIDPIRLLGQIWTRVVVLQESQFDCIYWETVWQVLRAKLKKGM